MSTQGLDRPIEFLEVSNVLLLEHLQGLLATSVQTDYQVSELARVGANWALRLTRRPPPQTEKK